MFITYNTQFLLLISRFLSSSRKSLFCTFFSFFGVWTIEIFLKSPSFLEYWLYFCYSFSTHCNNSVQIAGIQEVLRLLSVFKINLLLLEMFILSIHQFDLIEVYFSIPHCFKMIPLILITTSTQSIGTFLLAFTLFSMPYSKVHHPDIPGQSAWNLLPIISACR